MNTVDPRIEIIFASEGGVSAEILARTMEWVDEHLAQVETEELVDIREEFPYIPESIFDAVNYRIDARRYSNFAVRHASDGSLVIAGAALAIAYWVLEKTLGETLKEAWLESDSHKKLKEYLLNNRRKKIERIAREFRRWKFRDSKVEVRVTIEDEGKEVDYDIQVRISGEEIKPKVPPFEEIGPDKDD